jgi:hypothetical protein
MNKTPDISYSIVKTFDNVYNKLYPIYRSITTNPLIVRKDVTRENIQFLEEQLNSAQPESMEEVYTKNVIFHLSRLDEIAFQDYIKTLDVQYLILWTSDRSIANFLELRSIVYISWTKTRFHIIDNRMTSPHIISSYNNPRQPKYHEYATRTSNVFNMLRFDGEDDINSDFVKPKNKKTYEEKSRDVGESIREIQQKKDEEYDTDENFEEDITDLQEFGGRQEEKSEETDDADDTVEVHSEN